MKIIFEYYDQKFTAETKHDDVCINEVLALFSSILKAAGFSFSGEVIIEDSEEMDTGRDPDAQRAEEE